MTDDSSRPRLHGLSARDDENRGGAFGQSRSGQAYVMRGATSFLLAAIKKTRSELVGILADPNKLKAAASYHNIKPEWARFWIADELNRSGRRN